jgi:hypothetical protein
MPYKANIPLANDKLSSSQADLNGNFQAINTFIAVDHEAFGAAAEGKHKRVFFTQQAADPATGATEAALYTKDSATVPGTASLYYRPPNSGNAIEFTYALKANPGWTWLPSGIMMQWGTGVAGNATAIVFPTAFPNACLNVMLTPVNNVGARDFLQVGNFGVNNCIAYGQKDGGGFENVNVYFLAIGW